MSDDSTRDQSPAQLDTTPTTAESTTQNVDKATDAAIELHVPSTEQDQPPAEEITDEPQSVSTTESLEETQDDSVIHHDAAHPPPDDEQEDVADVGQLSDEPTPLPRIVTDLYDETRQSRAHSITSAISSVSSNFSFVKAAITKISEQKDAKKNVLLVASTKKALDKLNSPGFDTAQIFDTLRLAIESKITEVVVVALNCISKILESKLFEPIQVSPPKTNTALTEDPDIPVGGNTLVTPPPKVNLIDAAVDTIANAFQGEGTDEKIEVQVVRALMTAVINESLPVHGSSLLKAVRQIYNIFILSLSPMNQSVAQASLTHVVNTVFDKVEKIPSTRDTPLRSESVADVTPIDPQSKDDAASEPAEPLKLENLKSLNDEEERLVDQNNDVGDENELIVKDAFLLFRAMCKLSVKNLDNDSLDMRSHAVRSKLISLHIIHSIIKEHIDVFLSNSIVIHSTSQTEGTILVDAVRQYLCLSISRNAASAISPVFETTLEIFWLILSNLRYQFKREIPVFLVDIYFPIAELKNSTAHQKRYFLLVVQRVCNDPRALIEFYLNYDCDTAQPNITEKITDYLTKLALMRVDITPKQKYEYKEHSAKPISTYNLSQLPLLSISKLSSQAALADATLPFPVDYALKITSLDCIVGILRSLNSWAQKGVTPETRSSSFFLTRKRSSTNGSTSLITPTVASTEEVDDPQEFENLKQRKTLLQEGIRKFNFKAKRGIEYLLQNGFIENKEPRTIARFLLDQPGLDKAVIGEYLGEGDDANIAIMHSFVDLMEFTNLKFVEAMRRFLQSFRLPGEAQKIDRYMLKFAERYSDGNPGVFANADTAYVLSYSVIMLNTDQHSKNVKKKMTLDDFIKNNRGIDDGNSLPDEYLTDIFNEINQDEIKLQSEQHAALLSGTLEIPESQGFGLFGGRDINREAYNKASKEISNKSEKLFKSLGRNKGSKNVFYSASHIEHVKNIFIQLWMSFLACLTTPFRDEDEEDIDRACLEGLRLAISISCIFELDDAKTTFIRSLAQFCNLNNIKELKNKNIDAVILLLKCAEQHGNQLKESWEDVLVLISQVERLQLLAKGIEADVIPDIANAKMHRSSMESSRSHQPSSSFFGFGKKATLTEQAQINHHNQHLDPVIGQRLVSEEVSVSIDKIFTQSSHLTGTAIVEFIRALTDVAFEEIESSSESNTPRTFSLQKVIDVCHYNMTRIRVEYTNIWNVISQFFQKIANKDHNLTVIVVALDSLRQLSMRFMDIEELAGFKFQEDFLKPFDYILKHANDIQVTDMVLNCLNNLIILKGSKIKSGWKTIFSALEFTAADSNQQVVERTYEIVSNAYKEQHDSILNQDDAFGEMISVLKQIAKNTKFQKCSLQSLHKTKVIFDKVAELTLNPEEDEPLLKHHKDVFKDLWYPGLSCFNDVIMTGDDLEVRSRALNYLFDVLVHFGSRFNPEFWDQICINLLFPIFGVLSKHWKVNQFNNHDDLSVWLSTTLIQALRNMIALFTHYFGTLSRMLDGYLDLLISCICQENDTIARIGRSCLQQLITQNMEKFEPEHWDRITVAFEKLFNFTTARELFDADPLKSGNGNTLDETSSTQDLNEQSNDASPVNGNGRISRTKSTEELRAKAKNKNAIVVKCVLQLLMIETLSELFDDELFYELVPYDNLTRLSALLEKSFRFARKFNDDYNLRVRLYESGVIDKLPSLLKQESSSSAVFINVTFRLYRDSKKINQKQKDAISASLIPMCVSIVERYVSLDDNTQLKNISTWRPVVVEILQGYCELEENDFNKNCPHVYDLVLNILDKSVPTELRTAIKAFFSRVGDVYINEERGA